jgi:hypothetical protein
MVHVPAAFRMPGGLPLKMLQVILRCKRPSDLADRAFKILPGSALLASEGAMMGVKGSVRECNQVDSNGIANLSFEDLTASRALASCCTAWAKNKWWYKCHDPKKSWVCWVRHIQIKLLVHP